MDPKVEEAVLTCRERLYGTCVKDLSRNGRKQVYSDNMSFEDLDVWRRESMPEILRARHAEKQTMWLEKAELAKLMEWKLSRGKFRPTLSKLIQSNDPDKVREYSEQAFKVMIDYCDSSNDDDNEFTTIVRKSIDLVCQLRGVGPATSTLILSLAGPALRNSPDASLRDTPFFSDEVFDILNPEYGKIKYSTKEYFELVLPKLLLFNTRELQKIEEALWCLHRANKISGKLDGISAKLLTSVHETVVDQLVTAPPSKRVKK
ncbi:hypothetical protein KL932_001578 [Ogataea haglerorum]|nr:hypothetical protein KL915_003340 [Ogataea haglerorum]KAG7743513.1 hypothetical protein KL932_001578 [Ogataea haglerorum]KAG7758466.1 hypothetical protein KL947_002845 [Ogataea haglerorum]KAG7809147.1 hypothetical protein KL924_003201 [Ogataea haglerorum]